MIVCTVCFKWNLSNQEQLAVMRSLLVDPMDRITGSRSWLITFHLKQTVQTIMHWFLELYKDFEWKYQTVYCLYVTESTVWWKAKNVSANLHGVLQMKRFIQLITLLPLMRSILPVYWIFNVFHFIFVVKIKSSKGEENETITFF